MSSHFTAVEASDSPMPVFNRSRGASRSEREIVLMRKRVSASSGGCLDELFFAYGALPVLQMRPVNGA